MVLASVPRSRQTAHDKKRQGLHHKPTKHYAKTYWPYLPMFLILVVGTIINFSWSAGKAVLGYATNVGPASLLQETNIQRSQNSKTALSLNSKLASAAQAKANDMAARNYWSHVTPDGVQPWQFINDAGYTYMAAAENLAYGFDSSAAAVSGWMNSPGHRANILNGNYTEVGFGIANATNYQDNGEQTIIVAMYGQPQQVVTPSSALNGTAPVTARVAGPTTRSEAPAPTPTPAPTPATTTPTTQPISSKEDTVTPQPQPAQTLQARAVSRIDVLTSGKAQWAAAATALIAGICAIVFVVRHARLWRKLLVKGEAFIIHHPILDTVFVLVFVAGFLLTRTSGFIH